MSVEIRTQRQSVWKYRDSPMSSFSYSIAIMIKHAGLGLLFAEQESCLLSMLKPKF